jgi:hypothetical protein
MTSLVASYAGNILLFATFVPPEYRYQIPGMAMIAFAAGVGAHAIFKWIGQAAIVPRHFLPRARHSPNSLAVTEPGASP